MLDWLRHRLLLYSLCRLGVDLLLILLVLGWLLRWWCLHILNHESWSVFDKILQVSGLLSANLSLTNSFTSKLLINRSSTEVIISLFVTEIGCTEVWPLESLAFESSVNLEPFNFHFSKIFLELVVIERSSESLDNELSGLVVARNSADVAIELLPGCLLHLRSQRRHNPLTCFILQQHSFEFLLHI